MKELLGLTRAGAIGSDQANVFGNAFSTADRARAILVNDVRVAPTEGASQAPKAKETKEEREAREAEQLASSQARDAAYKAYIDRIRETALEDLQLKLEEADAKGKLARDMSGAVGPDEISVGLSRTPGVDKGYPPMDRRLETDSIGIEGKVSPARADPRNESIVEWYTVNVYISCSQSVKRPDEQTPEIINDVVLFRYLHQERFTYHAKNGYKVIR